MPLIKHPKRRGEWVELLFMARAAAHGLNVSKPWGDSLPYDFALEHNGIFIRVQVKSTTCADPRGYVCSTYRLVRHGRKVRPRKYKRSEVDFFAFYIVPEDVWYIIPAGEVVHSCSHILLNPRRPNNKYFPFLEAWHLLTGRRSPA